MGMRSALCTVLYRILPSSISRLKAAAPLVTIHPDQCFACLSCPPGPSRAVLPAHGSSERQHNLNRGACYGPNIANTRRYCTRIIPRASSDCDGRGAAQEIPALHGDNCLAPHCRYSRVDKYLENESSAGDCSTARNHTTLILYDCIFCRGHAYIMSRVYTHSATPIIRCLYPPKTTPNRYFGPL